MEIPTRTVLKASLLTKWEVGESLWWGNAHLLNTELPPQPARHAQSWHHGDDLIYKAHVEEQCDPGAKENAEREEEEQMMM